MRSLLLATVTVVSLAFAGQAAAATYYVSASGSDSAAGTSASAPWQSVAKVNATTLAAGDTVLFQGGSTFSGLLLPKGSGTAAAPIAFGSYGTGRANLSGGIQLQSQSNLVFDGLTVDTGAWQTSGTTRGIRTSDTGTGVQNVVVRNCRFANVAIGLLFSSHLDRGWTLTNNTIQYTRDSGILIYDPNVASEVGASDLTFTGNQILDTGLDTSITYKKHGVYDIGTNITWRNNVIRNFSEGGFSLRAHGNSLIGNTISGGPYAIYYSPYDSTAGTTTIAYNKISNVTADGIELASSGNVSDVESFVIQDNSIVSSGSSPGIRVIGTSGSVSLANNLVQTAGGAMLRVDAMPGGGLSERNNLWWSTSPVWSYLGSTYSSLGGYQAASGRGAADRSANPQLDANLVPASGSPVVDGGTTSVASYVGDCAGNAYHYCDAAPDLGAVELSAGAVLGPLAPPSNLVGTSATQNSIDLAWTASPDTRVVSYVVAQGGATLTTTTGLAWTAANLACGTTYTFSVTGRDATGSLTGAATASAATAACTAPAPGPTPSPLSPPSNLVASSITGTSLALGWTASPDARVVSYVVSQNGVALPATTATSLGVTGLACSTSYSFSVAGVDAAGNASASVSTTAVTPACADTTAPALTVTSPTNGQSVPLSFQIKATASDNGSGVKNVTFWFDGYAPCVDATAPYVSCTISTKQGWHDIRVRATDNAGNYVERTLKVYADKKLRITAATTTTVTRRKLR